VSVVSSAIVRDAIVLAAGNGDRFQDGSGESKLLRRVSNQPLILRTLATAAAAGIRRFDVVLGYQAEQVRRVIASGLPRGTTARYHYNPDWHLENGVSASMPRQWFATTRFALLMADHLFTASMLSTLLSAVVPADQSILAVDSRPTPAEVAAEATKVCLSADRITAIGKNLTRWDALDTGLFVCSPLLFGALDAAQANRDTTLTGGIRLLASRGLMGWRETSAAWWDIDTATDLASAEALLQASDHQ
jgi:choline kinase